MLGCALSVMAVPPAFTAKDATRVEVATNRTAASSVTVFTAGLNARVMLPDAVTVAGADSCRLRVCCSPLAILVLSKFQTRADSGGENPVPANTYVRVPTVSVPEKAEPVAGLNRIAKETDCPAAIVTAFPEAVVNAAPVTSKGETVSACENGFRIDSVQASCAP